MSIISVGLITKNAGLSAKRAVTRKGCFVKRNRERVKSEEAVRKTQQQNPKWHFGKPSQYQIL